MDDNIKIDMSETNRGKNQIIVDKIYKFNFSYKIGNNITICRYIHYKTDKKCDSFIVLNDKEDVIKYKDSHNHFE